MQSCFCWQALKESNPRPRFWRPMLYHLTKRLRRNWLRLFQLFLEEKVSTSAPFLLLPRKHFSTFILGICSELIPDISKKFQVFTLPPPSSQTLFNFYLRNLLGGFFLLDLSKIARGLYFFWVWRSNSFTNLLV